MSWVVCLMSSSPVLSLYPQYRHSAPLLSSCLSCLLPGLLPLLSTCWVQPWLSAYSIGSYGRWRAPGASPASGCSPYAKRVLNGSRNAKRARGGGVRISGALHAFSSPFLAYFLLTRRAPPRGEYTDKPSIQGVRLLSLWWFVWGFVRVALEAILPTRNIGSIGGFIRLFRMKRFSKRLGKRFGKRFRNGLANGSYIV